MNQEHFYTLCLQWIGNPILNTIKNDRLFEISIAGKEPFKGSADKVFFGDQTLYNPEDLLLSALSSCHMMSYFYLCRKQKLQILSYTDSPLGTLEVDVDGSGKFKTVTLNPSVTILNPTDLLLANSLHFEAKKLCFIANSCSFEIKLNPKINIQE